MKGSGRTAKPSQADVDLTEGNYRPQTCKECGLEATRFRVRCWEMMDAVGNSCTASEIHYFCRDHELDAAKLFGELKTR